MNPVSRSFRITTGNRANFIGHLVNALCLLYCVFFPDRIGFPGFDLLNSRFSIFVHLKKITG